MGLGEVLRMEESIESKEGKLTLLALLMMLYVMAMFASIAVHEVLGHGLFTVLLGGEFYAFYLAPGNGFASLWLPQTMSRSAVALVYLAGILVQMLVAVPVLFLAIPRLKNLLVGLFALLFCVGMLVHSSMYLVMGYYYDGGDTRYAVGALGIQPDIFIAAGIILAGTFVLLISMAALRFLGRFMSLDGKRKSNMALAIFWFPTILLNGVLAMTLSLTSSGPDLAHLLINSAMLLMFVGLAILLVPLFSEPVAETARSISMRGVVSVIICFMLMMAGWAGIFGLSRETAHGVLLKAPPVQAEIYYSDYAIGNAEFTVHSNGTVRVDIYLRNMMESPSPLESRIHSTFDHRPDWDRYVARSRNMLMAMLALPRDVGEGLEFSTDFSTIVARDIRDDLGRRCTTHVSLAQIGARHYHLTQGDQSPDPGNASLRDFDLIFTDPWAGQRGFLDRVTVSWDQDLEAVEILASSVTVPEIPYIEGGTRERAVVWMNADFDSAPHAYIFSFKIV